ncbi:MAG: nucleotidyltransferase domain-containing protein [Candidatus Pacearchaeota archaeon]
MAEEGGKKKDDRREKGVFPSMDKKAILEKIKDKLSERICVEKVFLFGSRARGDYTEGSDYDLAIISPDFEDISFGERQKIVKPAIREILPDSPIEAICYTPEEYKKGKKAFLPYMIEKEGISA